MLSKLPFRLESFVVAQFELHLTTSHPEQPAFLPAAEAYPVALRLSEAETQGDLLTAALKAWCSWRKPSG